jgi:O-antigen/teichoic acid export membrane protein
MTLSERENDQQHEGGAPVDATNHRQPQNPTFVHRAVRNLLFSGFGTVSNFAIGFLFAGLTIRYLGESRAGFFMAISALTGLNALLGDFGLGAPATRRIAVLNAEKNLQRARVVVSSVATVSLISGLVIAIPVFFSFSKIFEWAKLDNVFYGDAFGALSCTLGSFLLTQATNPWRSTYVGLERFGVLNMLATVFGLAGGLSGIAILTISPTMTSLAAVRLGLSIVRFGVDAYFLRKFLGGIPLLSWNWKEIKPMMSFGGWVYFQTLGGFLVGRANSLVLTTFLGSAALPYYELPQRFYIQIHGALGSVSQFLFPMFSSFGDKARAEMVRLGDRLRWLMATASGFSYAGLAVAGPMLLDRIVGPEFSANASVPLYLACAQGFFQAQDIVPYFFSWSLGQGKPNSVIELSQGVLVILTSLLLIPRIGFVGASASQLWVVPLVCIHVFWVLKLVVLSKLEIRNTLKAYVSPFLMVGVSILIAETLGTVLPKTLAALLLRMAVGFLVGGGVLVAVERFFFRSEGRWAAVVKIFQNLVAIPLSKRRLSVSQEGLEKDSAWI